jgi:hypothetical protein
MAFLLQIRAFGKNEDCIPSRPFERTVPFIRMERRGLRPFSGQGLNQQPPIFYEQDPKST